MDNWGTVTNTNSFRSGGFCGAEGQNRTVDTSLFRAVLYQLSYLGIPEEFWKGVPVYRITVKKSTPHRGRGGEGGI